LTRVTAMSDIAGSAGRRRLGRPGQVVAAGQIDQVSHTQALGRCREHFASRGEHSSRHLTTGNFVFKCVSRCCHNSAVVPKRSKMGATAALKFAFPSRKTLAV
jgi:hypothetical protein